jgi:hypothetical protein
MAIFVPTRAVVVVHPKGRFNVWYSSSTPRDRVVVVMWLLLLFSSVSHAYRSTGTYRYGRAARSFASPNYRADPNRSPWRATMATYNANAAVSIARLDDVLVAAVPVAPLSTASSTKHSEHTRRMKE